jgi:hypothetical protein
MNIRSLSQLDRAALTLMGILMALTVILLAVGDRSAPYVREFSWANRPVGAEDNAFALRFSRSMDRPKVAAKIQIKSDPSNPQSQFQPISQVMPGKISWSGKKMLYTLNFPVPYGRSYELKVQDVTAASNDGKPVGKEITPFVQAFNTREKMFGYIGTEGADRGRLMIQRFPQTSANKNPEKSPVAVAITSPEYLVKDFRFTPGGEGVFFSALLASNGNQLLSRQKIYRTSIQNSGQNLGQNPEPKLVLDSNEYQNIRFELSNDGKIIVVHRVGVKNPSDFGIWVIDAQQGTTLQRISQGGKFKITPDSASIAVSEGQGVALKPLVLGTDSTEFMAKYGQLLSFSPNGAAAALEKYNDDSSRDLFLVTNQGVEKKLLNVKGEIQAAQFSADARKLYAITAEFPKVLSENENLADTGKYSAQPYLMSIDLTTFKSESLVKLPQQQDTALSLSPDGQSLLLDQVVTGGTTNQKILTAADGQPIERGMIWMLNLTQPKAKPELLPISGFNPRWAP